jgi:Fic family protein
MGRMWHTLLLSEWKDFFAWLPVETLIHERQSDYYQAINNSNTQGESTIFVEFMLRTIRDSLFELINNENKSNVGTNVGIKNNDLEKHLFQIIRSNPRITAKELAVAVSLTQRQVERTISKLKNKGKIERVGAKKNGYWKINID